ncbi:MAG: FtsQ-type POTRA domain-containing protein [Bacilli bacterium]|nr:FtsQ-type POTRA domain-containing protein [Bacilli bacterium]
MEKKGKKKLRSSVKFVIRLLLFITILSLCTYFVLNLRIKNIYIEGNSSVSDIEIINAAGIKNYPKIYRLHKKELIDNISAIPLIKEVKIKRNILGKLTISVKEEKLLFYYKYNDKYITNNGTLLDDNGYYGYPILINFTPDTIMNKLLEAFDKIDYDIIRMINLIEYTPYKSQDGEIFDDGRFTLFMNDGNTIIIDLVNIKKLNEYMKYFASLGLDERSGYLYLDTITEDNIYFRVYTEEELNERQRIIDEVLNSANVVAGDGEDELPKEDGGNNTTE